MEWMFLPLRRYFQFNGRSRRKEFWMWVLFVVIASFILGILDGVLGLEFGKTIPTDGGAGSGFAYGFASTSRTGILGSIFSLATLIPYLAVSVRRLHDINRSGWWVVMPIVPYAAGAVFLVMAALGQTGSNLMIGLGLVVLALICGIVLLVWYCMKGTDGPNRFGPDPLDEGEDVAEVFS